jgi:hypothetical protein
LTIPEVFWPALSKLAALNEESARKLIDAMRSTPPVLNPKSMAARLADSVQTISVEDLADMAGAMLALSSVRVVNQVAVSEFVHDVCDSLKGPRAPQIANRDVLVSRLTELLEAEPLILGAKASALQREHTNVLISARILSDIRPVFADGPEAAQGATIVHTLKISYLHDNDAREFFVAMDDADLSTIQKIVSRAETKSKTLKDIIIKSGLVDLDQK